MFRPLPARASTPCPLRSRVSRTTLRKSRRSSASSTSSSSICRIPCKASTPKFPAPRPPRPPAPPTPRLPPVPRPAPPAFLPAQPPPPTRSIPTASATSPAATPPSHAQFYLGEIFYKQKQYVDAVAAYDKVLTAYPKSFKLGPARLRKGLALIEVGQKTAGIRELREVVKRFPGSDEDRLARAKLKELGAAITATR